MTTVPIKMSFRALTFIIKYYLHKCFSIKKIKFRFGFIFKPLNGSCHINLGSLGKKTEIASNAVLCAEFDGNNNRGNVKILEYKDDPATKNKGNVRSFLSFLQLTQRGEKFGAHVTVFFGLLRLSLFSYCLGDFGITFGII